MRVKLDDAKKVLEGLTVEDYNMIVKNAQEMSLLSEDAVWQVLQTPEYAERQRGIPTNCQSPEGCRQRKESRCGVVSLRKAYDAMHRLP